MNGTDTLARVLFVEHLYRVIGALQLYADQVGLPSAYLTISASGLITIHGMPPNYALEVFETPDELVQFLGQDY